MKRVIITIDEGLHREARGLARQWLDTFDRTRPNFSRLVAVLLRYALSHPGLVDSSDFLTGRDAEYIR